MPIYSGSAASPNNQIGANVDLRTTGGNTARLLEFGTSVGVGGATAAFALGRPANDSAVVQWGGYPFVPAYFADPATALVEGPTSITGSQTTIGVQWTVAPTVPATFFRRAALPNTVQAGVIWTFPRGLLMVQLRGLVLWNIAAGPSLLNVNIDIHE